MSELERARTLVLRYGWNATSYQILNPGMRLWFTEARDAVVGFVERSGVRVVAGAPICPPARLAEVLSELESDSRRAGRDICFFGAEQRVRDVLGDIRHTAVLIGAQPAWNPASWPEMLSSHASLRQQLNRARNKGVTVSRWPAYRASGSAALRACLLDWLGSRGLPTLHFLVEPDTLSNLRDRLVFVAEREGRVVGFLVASPIPLRNGWLVEQLVRDSSAPNGTAELLIDAAVSEMAGRGDEHVTLGLAPLSRRAGAPAAAGPPWLRLLFGWTRAHVHRFYNFEGLEAFKAKFRAPAWEPVYLIASGTAVTWTTIHAVAAAFSGGSVAAMLGRAVASAARQEARWLTGRS